MKRRQQTLYQYEPLFAPASWQGEERQLVNRLVQILDDLHARIGALERRMNEVEGKKDASL